MTRRILVIEDEAALRLALSDRLRSEGYEVETAADGEQGWERARQGGFDLVLLDVMLPGRSGFDLCRDLRREGVATPILMLTARGENKDRVQALDIGFDDYRPKPFKPRELAARLRAILRRRAGGARGEVLRFGRLEIDRPAGARDALFLPVEFEVADGKHERDAFRTGAAQ